MDEMQLRSGHEEDDHDGDDISDDHEGYDSAGCSSEPERPWRRQCYAHVAAGALCAFPLAIARDLYCACCVRFSSAGVVLDCP